MVPLSRMRQLLHPATVWLAVLIAVFVSESTIMLVLPWLMPSGTSFLFEAIVDAVLLTSILSPLLWITVVRPLHEVDRLRSQFLSDLFAQMEADRRRVALELHDSVGQSLTLLVSGLRSAKELAADPEFASRWERFQELAQQALKEVKGLALGLRPSLLDDLGLPPALERLVADLEAHARFKIKLVINGMAERRLPQAVETAAFRIVQEALSNVLRHAEARHVEIAVRLVESCLQIEISDDGRGMDGANLHRPTNGHLGLTSMKERATLLGGDLTINSASHQGTRVLATIPIKE